MNFGFLQANHVRLVFFDDGGQLVWAGTQAVDIKETEFHSRCHCAKVNSAGMVAEIRQAGCHRMRHSANRCA